MKDSYVLVFVTASLMAGILTGEYLRPAAPVWLWPVCLLPLLLVQFTHRMGNGLKNCCLYAAVMLMGIWVHALHEKENRVMLTAAPVSYEAVLLSNPQVHGKVIQCDLMVISNGHTLKVKASILRDTVDNRWQHIHLGDGIRATSVLQQPRNYYPDANFDYVRWLRVHGFRAQTFIYYADWQKASVKLAPLSSFDRLRLRALQFRNKLIDRYRMQGLDGQQEAVLTAMTLGDKSLISSDVRNNYSISGASHLLALSGLHLGIIYAILAMLTGGRRYRSQWQELLRQLLILSAIWSYTVLVGMSASVIRSAVMLTIYAIVILLRRRSFSPNSLALAAFLILLQNPLALWDVGFQMSFLAVAGILLFVPLMERFLTAPVLQRRGIWWIVSMAEVSIAAQLGVFPVTMYYFNRFSSYFLLTNFVAIPLATAVLYLTLLFFASSPLPWLQHATATVIGTVTGWLNGSLSWLSALPGASIEHIHINHWQVAAIYVIILCVYRIICLTLHPR
jgi:competence protein ComEC